MRRIHWSNRAPVTVLIDEPSSGSQTLHHASDSQLLFAGEPEQHQTRTNQIERTRAEGVQWIVEDGLLTHLAVWKIQSLQVGDIDVGRHHLPARSDSLGEPNGHGSPARADLKASPARLDQLTSSTRKRVENIFQETQPIVFGLLAPSRVESVTWPETQSFSG